MRIGSERGRSHDVPYIEMPGPACKHKHKSVSHKALNAHASGMRWVRLARIAIWDKHSEFYSCMRTLTVTLALSGLSASTLFAI